MLAYVPPVLILTSGPGLMHMHPSIFYITRKEVLIIYRNQKNTYLCKSDQLTWCNQNVWRVIEHQAGELLPFNWLELVSWVEWIERFLL